MIAATFLGAPEPICANSGLSPTLLSTPAAALDIKKFLRRIIPVPLQIVRGTERVSQVELRQAQIGLPLQ
jgi:hypothetical protein